MTAKPPYEPVPYRPVPSTQDEVDDLIDAWHEGADQGLPLHEYLGWTWEQYAHWAETNVLPDAPSADTPAQAGER